jgi:formylglycine-generating enzyme required for sulfatase activity
MSKDGKNAQRKVIIKEDFQMGVYPVTQVQWEAVMGNNPSWFSRFGGGKEAVKDIPDADLKQFPVEGVSWKKAQEFLKQLNDSEKKSGWVYRLPTEAEWEYACRGGATSIKDCSFDFYFDKATKNLSATQANFWSDFPLKRTTKVRSYPPNKLGLYDMHGNVWQWCEDAFNGGSAKVFRGGSWSHEGSFCRAATRGKGEPSVRDRNLGFRVVRFRPGK